MIVRAAFHPVRRALGFSLIELVVAIVLIAIALTFMANMFFSNPGRSVEPLQRQPVAKHSRDNNV